MDNREQPPASTPPSHQSSAFSSPIRPAAMPVYPATFPFDGASLPFLMSGFLRNRPPAVARAHATISRSVSLGGRSETMPLASGPASCRTPAPINTGSAMPTPIFECAPGGNFNNGGSNNGGSSRKPRKDRLSNWSHQEVLALIAVKRDQFLDELDAVDGRDLMVIESSKWVRVSEALMRANLSPCLRDAVSCKAKWNLIIPEYKRISDYLGRTVS